MDSDQIKIIAITSALVVVITKLVDILKNLISKNNDDKPRCNFDQECIFQLRNVSKIESWSSSIHTLVVNTTRNSENFEKLNQVLSEQSKVLAELNYNISLLNAKK